MSNKNWYALQNAKTGEIIQPWSICCRRYQEIPANVIGGMILGYESALIFKRAYTKKRPDDPVILRKLTCS